MTKPQKIEGTNSYEYKGFKICRYLGGARQTTTKWSVDSTQGKEIVADYNTLWAAKDYIDQH